MISAFLAVDTHVLRVANRLGLASPARYARGSSGVPQRQNGLPH